MSRKWFSHPPVCVMDWAKLGLVHQVTSVEAAAQELIKWPTNKMRNKAAILISKAYAGTADIEKAKKAFEAAAREAKVWLPYRGP